MPISRSKKEEVVSKIKDILLRAKSLLIVRFHGLSVSKTHDLRRRFRAEDTQYVVVKKSLLEKACEQAGLRVPENLEGEVAIAASFGDELAAFKIALEVSKKEKDALKLLGGFFPAQGGSASGGDMQLIDAESAYRLGAIPSREGLLSQLMSVIQGNTRKFVVLLDQLSRKGQNS